MVLRLGALTGGGGSRRLANALLLLAAVLLFLSFGYTEMAGADLWWHLAAGRELVQTGSPWMVDDWSFSAHGGLWRNHEWLSDLLYYGWAVAWGVASLVYWKWLVVTATFLLLLRVLARAGGNLEVGLLLSTLALANAAPFLDIRPHLYSLLGFCLLLWLLLGRRAPFWQPVLLFVVWVNLHGGFFFGLMALAILLCPWREPTLVNLRRAALTWCLGALACVLNPSGVKAVLYPLTYAFDTGSPFREIAEWLSPFRPGGIRSPLFFVLMWLPITAVFYLLPRVRRAVAVPWEGLALTILTLAMALTSRRFIPLFGISLGLLLAPLLGLLATRLRLERARLPIAALTLALGVYRMLPWPLEARPAFHYLVAEYSFPVDMLDFMQANGLSGNVYALWNWGGYIHWRTDGRLKVFIDGRADTVYDAGAYEHYVGVLATRAGWLEAVEASGADFLLWPHNRRGGRQKLRELVESGRWRLLYRDSVSWLAARADLPLPPRAVDSPPGPWRDMTRAQVSAWNGQAGRAMVYAEAVRRVMPWHRDACNLLASLHRGRGEEDAADRVLAQCRALFPSLYLR